MSCVFFMGALQYKICKDDNHKAGVARSETRAFEYVSQHAWQYYGQKVVIR